MIPQNLLQRFSKVIVETAAPLNSHQLGQHPSLERLSAAERHLLEKSLESILLAMVKVERRPTAEEVEFALTARVWPGKPTAEK